VYSLSEQRNMDKTSIRKIGIFRALQLGDLLCAIPAVRALKDAMPQADIYLIGLPGSEALARRFRKYFAGIIPFPGYPGLPEQAYDVKKIASFIAYMQEQRFDLMLQMQGNGTLVNQLVELFGAACTGGYYMPHDYKPPGEWFMPYPDHGHEVLRHLSLMRHLGIGGTHAMEFPVEEEDIRKFAALDLGLERKKYVCIHPGSRGAWRRWPPAFFAALADSCCRQGIKVVLTGTKEELGIVEATAGQMKHEAVIAAGRTDLGTMAVLLQDAFALISNCTGVAHMAAAIQTPGIIISMDGEPHRWGPMDKTLFYTLDWLADPDFAKAEKALDILLRNGSFKGAENLLYLSPGNIPLTE